MKTWKRAFCLLLTLVMLVGMFSICTLAAEVENPEVTENLTVTLKCAKCDREEIITGIPASATYFGGQYEIEGVTKVNLHLDLDKVLREDDKHQIAEGMQDPCVTYAYDEETAAWSLVPREADRAANSFGTVSVVCENKPDKPWHPDKPCDPDDCPFGFILVTVDYNMGTTTDTEVYLLKKGSCLDLEEPYRRGYTFNGWYIGNKEYKGGKLNCSCIMRASWTRDGSCCDTSNHKHKIVYTDGVAGEVVFKDVVKYVKHMDKTPTIKDPTRSGYRFAGWSPAVATYATECETYTAKWVPERAPMLNMTCDHIAYLKGYGAGMIKPEGEITRAEVATILYRLLDEDTLEYYYTTRNNFSDVNKGDWYNEAVSTLANAGVITGYGAGRFSPNAPISRAELVAMLSRLTCTTSSRAKCTFVDVSAKHWAYDDIALAQYMGWVKGYGAGYFYPDESITRAEVAAILNRMLDRDDCVLRDTKHYADNPVNAWYYDDILEASISH